MDDKQIIEYLKSNPDISSNIKISANINVLVRIMILKGWITESEYEKAVDKSINNLVEETVKRMTKEEKQSIEATIKFEDLFGTKF